MTIVGQHTVTELRDLLAAKDLEVSALGKAYQSYKSQWDLKDAAASAKFDTDYKKLRDRYFIARKDAIKRISKADNSSISPFVITAEDEWQDVLKSLKAAGDPGPTTIGDSMELYGRLANVGGPNPLPNGEIQPEYGSDFDLNTFNKAGDILEQIDPALVNKKGLSFIEKLAIGTVVVAGVGAAAELVLTLHTLAKTASVVRGKRE